MPSPFVPEPNQSDTLSAVQGVQSILQSIMQYDLTTPLYTAVQFGQFKDPTDFLANGGSCCEMHGNGGNVKRYSTGGKVKDALSLVIFSLVDMTDESAAWTRIYTVHDTLANYFMAHTQLGGNIGNVWRCEFANNYEYDKVKRGKGFCLAHMMELSVLMEWTVSTGFIA